MKRRPVIIVLLALAGFALVWWTGMSGALGAGASIDGAQTQSVTSSGQAQVAQTGPESTASTATADGGTGPADTGSGDGTGPTPAAAQAGGQAAQEYSLLPTWEARYDGDCTDCHIPDGDRNSFHPTNRRKQLKADTWYFDDDEQTGPNLQLDNFQPAGFQLDGETLYCSDCHTASNPTGLATNQSGRTGDPHSVHQAVYERIGCDRCHGATATQATGGVNSPIDMHREFDGKFLATEDEAGFDANGSADGAGYTMYLQADSSDVVVGSCGDCHGQYHGKGGFGFTFDSHTGAGPQSPTPGGAGLLVNETALGCGTCHAEDVHAVHTNGEMNTKVDFRTAMDLSVQTKPENSAGAETCIECHGTEVVRQTGTHWELQTARRLGLIGARDGPPNSSIQTAQTGDCSFCHQ